MQRRYSLAHFILASVLVLVLASLMVCVEARAQIVFSSDRVWDDWHWEIYVMDNDGGNQRNLTNHLGEDRDPSWSPNGKQILFTSDREDRGGDRQVYVMDIEGNNRETFLTTTLMTGNLHGHPTVNGLSLYPLEVDTAKST